MKLVKKKLKLRIASTFFSQCLGLMFRKLGKDEGLLIVFKNEKIRSVHMFFVFQKLNIAFLNEKKIITKVQRAYPFRSLIKNKCWYILEVPAEVKVRKGERLVM